MKSETEQLLGTLEVILENPSCIFIWETEEQGEFNVWNLAIAEGFVSLTDVDVAIAHWQAVERWGTPTDQTNYEYAPPRNERDDLWNAEIEAFRAERYQQLAQLLKSELQNLQALRLSIPKQSDNSFEWSHPNFCFYILIGKTDDGDWLCLSPTVPAQIRSLRSKQLNSETAEAIATKREKTLDLQSKIQRILSELPPITLYGYYYGGYNYTYEYKIMYVTATKKALAVELALQAAGMLTVKKTNVEYVSDEYNIQKLNDFFNVRLSDCTIYTLSFWDIAYTYEIGQAPTSDWLGMRCVSEFDYNP